ncbi:MAG: alpha/beta hydrolase [Acidimicrobiia bacterium]|nr:alpha/beta hydrolase [Acidimicrobiia bacterium]
MPAFPSSDGLDVAAWDLGGDGPAVLLAHATGFHGLVWRPVAAHLADFHCYSFDERGHGDSSRPPDHSYDWTGFADDARAVLDGFGLQHPFGVGHSAGAAALLMAEAFRPGSFRALYLWEPVVMPMDDPLGPHDNPLSEGALRRRAVFSSRREAFENFASKPPFSALHPDALGVYVEHGFADADDGQVRLKCRPADESQMYRMGSAHAAFSHFGDVRCPVVLACGETTNAFGPDLIEQQAARLPHARTEVLPGLGHFGPLEDPAAVASAVRRAFTQAG